MSSTRAATDERVIVIKTFPMRRINMAMLARFRVGRVLLHLLALLGDGRVRFHVEGIARELPCHAPMAAFAKAHSVIVTASPYEATLVRVERQVDCERR